MPVIDRHNRAIDLSSQRSAIDATVLDQLRGALHLNDFFIHLNLSHNALGDHNVAMLCAIIKGKTFLETLELSDCALTDRDFSLYLIPAIIARRKLKSLDVSKNERLTDVSIDSLCQLISEGELQSLRLVGTSLSRLAGRRIAEVMERNDTLEVCELPFTVGYDVINRVELLLQRNVRHKSSLDWGRSERLEIEEMLERVDEEKRALGTVQEQHSPKADARRVQSDGARAATIGLCKADQEVALARYYTTGGRRGAVPPTLPALNGADERCRGGRRSGGSSRLTENCLASSSRANRSAVTATAVPTCNRLAALSSSSREHAPGLYDDLTDFGSLHAATFRSAADPAINRSIGHLRTLDARCAAVEHHRSAELQQMRLRTGLDAPAKVTPDSHRGRQS